MIDDCETPVTGFLVPLSPTPRPLTAEEAIAVLRDLMHGSESEPTRLGAAKTVLERIAPKQDEESRRREADERNASIAEAKEIMADHAAAKSAGLHQPVTLDQAGPPEPVDPGDGA